MPDLHARGGRLETERPEASSQDNEKFDAERAPSSSGNSQINSLQRGLACHDVQHWHGPACRLPDRRLGLLEGKVGTSSCSSWSRIVEEPPRRSRSVDLASFKNQQSVAMLPYLLSTLAVSRTRSEPCIFGKDFFRITLPLPGESSACRATVSSNATPENNLSPYDAEPLIGFETKEETVMIPTPELLSWEETKNSVRTQRSWDDSVSLDDDAAKALPANEVPPNESSSKAFSTCLERVSESSHESGTLEIMGQVCSVSDTLFCKKIGVVSEVIVPHAMKTPHWDDWWTCQPEEVSAEKLCSKLHRLQHHRNKVRDQACSPTSPDQLDEDALDENYLVLDETKRDEQLESGSQDAACLNSEGEGSVENVCLDGCNSAIEGSPTTTSSNSSKAYKDDDMWSDERFGSSCANAFPPPISILAHETHPGLPSHVPKTLWRSMKRDGRFVLQEVQARPREFFQATREFGRLRLQLVRPDSDSNGSFTETASLEDKEGSPPPSGSVETLTGVAGFSQPEGICVEPSEAVASRLNGFLQGFSSEDKMSRRIGIGEDENLFLDLTQSGLLSNNHGSTGWEEHPDSNFGQMVDVEELGSRTSADPVSEDCVDQRETDVVLEGSSGVDYNSDSDVVLGSSFGGDCHVTMEAITPKDEDFGRQNYTVIIALDTKELETCIQTDAAPLVAHGSEEPYRQDFQQPCFSGSYGFDNNRRVLSPSQAFIHLPIQPAAVR